MTFTIALEADEGFQKFLARKIALEVELKFSVGRSTYLGFVTGLDEDWVQITTSDEQRAVLLNISSIDSIEDTGVKLNTASIEVATKIRGYARSLRAVADTALNRANISVAAKRDAYPLIG